MSQKLPFGRRGEAEELLAVILIMFAGRVGPLTLAFSLAHRGTKKRITYAEESVMVG